VLASKVKKLIEDEIKKLDLQGETTHHEQLKDRRYPFWSEIDNGSTFS
jgi:hypothetical protein